MRSCSYTIFFLAKRRGASEVVAALIVFVITLAISAISVNFLTQRASTSSSIIVQESERVKLEQLAMIKILDLRRAENGMRVLLYNPSDVTVGVETIFVGGRPHPVDLVLRPFEVTEVFLNPGIQEDDLGDVYFLTSEGVLIHAKT